MENFIWPFMIFLLPLPWILRHCLPRSKENSSETEPALKVPFMNRIAVFGTFQTHRKAHRTPYLLWSAWIFLCIAAMRPVWYDQAIPTPQEVRNIMLAVDVSGSMAEQDFDYRNQPVSRLTLLKKVVSDFITNRKNDRVGLIVFGSEAHTLSPLSTDLKTLKEIFKDVGIGIAGEQTAIGDALALAVKDTAKIPSDKKIVILMSDGYNNAGVIPVEQALSLAKKHNIIVYTVGIGSDQKQLNQFFGMMPFQVPSSLDEKTLANIASQTGGKYFRAKSSADLKNIYQIIEELETTKITNPAAKPRIELLYFPLLIALLLWTLCQPIFNRLPDFNRRKL